MKLAVYWDLRYTDPQRHTGVGKHVIEVIRGLARKPDMQITALIAKGQETLWQNQRKCNGLLDLQTQLLPLSEKQLRLKSLPGIPQSSCRIGEFDAVYSPMERIPAFRGVPLFTTVHGIPSFEETLPQHVLRSWPHRMDRLRQRLLMFEAKQSCRRIFAVSDYLKRRMVEIFGLPEAIIEVVGNGVGDPFFQQHESYPDTTSLSLLAVGGINAFDGAESLLRVARCLSQDRPDLRIAIAGDRHESPWEEQMRALPNVDWLGFLPSDALARQMRQSLALLYLPTVESFGIIGLEAMAVGLPVLAQKSTATPEVLGDAAIWVDPSNPQGMLHAITELEMDSAYRTSVIDKGFERAGHFRWSNVVDRVHAAIANCL